MNPHMIDVYSWPTPNGHKVHIMLEECGYRLGKDWLAHPIHIGQGEQFTPEFLTISPNNKIPALVDPNGPDGKPISLFESGAILLYLAAKYTKIAPDSNKLMGLPSGPLGSTKAGILLFGLMVKNSGVNCSPCPI